MSAAILFRNRDGDEVEISLHPISLALVVAELIEDRARARCLRKGHDAGQDGYCRLCGLMLPDNETRYQGWMPDAYRTIRKATS